MNSQHPPLLRRLQLRFAQARFFTFSALLHLIIVIMAGSVVLIKNNTEPPDFEAATETGIFSVEPDSAVAPQPPAPQPPVENFTPATPNASAPPVSVIATTNAVGTSMMNPASVPMGAGTSVESLVKKAGDLGGGMTSGGPKASGGTGMKLFGVQARANSVVVVVDVSGSMIGGEKSVKTYEVLEREVGKLIKELGEMNSFGLVVFSRDAEPYKPALTRATREEKERANNWLKRMSPEGAREPRASEEKKAFHKGTRADLGLQRAFEMQPDAIFFVSDGEPTGANPAQILKQVDAAQANRPQRVVVHTIAYLADSGQPFMRDLAQKNGGNFREVNPKDVR